ncbi:gamma-glutamyl-gamma-aminobutyrate hydrolase family protein [Caldimonas brevitalea]|uniref:Gamma-glutamyl-gamma-aminobutyrate hydrolase n=1 Tax=Caldimonas brevitalea TaxID=413882 RepID=A0A0G3BS70_9BURK|nr:gamma-glutamyl-gamma-aminobutyrate hydrolase family protein [Caldimonas brevitalea]AKJ29375.1 hypothetical protein AAW51_2684 [Caldimonas brevitalea]
MIRNPGAAGPSGLKRLATERDSSDSEGETSVRPQRQRTSNNPLAELGRPPQTRPTVAYRDCGHGTGAFWDHYTLQQTTGRPTTASHGADVTPTIQSTDPTKNKQNYNGGLPHNVNTTTGHGQGLLVVTGGNYGLTSETPRHPSHVPSGSAADRHGQRVAHEAELMKQAQLTGRPMVGICGGSWRVLESHGGSTQQLNPSTHQARAMPFIKKDGTISNNFTTHGMEIRPDTMLHSQTAWQRNEPMDVDGGAAARPTWHKNEDPIQHEVNTVHWAAAREDANGLVPNHPNPNPEMAAKLASLEVSARDTNHDFPYKGATPDGRPSHSVEAFESRSGAPVMGMQWHPEAYSSGHDDKPAAAMSQAALDYMAKAGDAYEARRTMTAAFKQGMQNNPPVQPAQGPNAAPQAAGWQATGRAPNRTA